MDVSGVSFLFPQRLEKNCPLIASPTIFLDRPLVRIHVIAIGSPHGAFAHGFEVVASGLQLLTVTF